MKQIPEALLEQLLEDYEKPEDLLGSDGLLASLQKAVMERALEAELTAHLGYDRHDPAGRGRRYAQVLCMPSSGSAFDHLNSVFESYSFDHLGQALRPV